MVGKKLFQINLESQKMSRDRAPGSDADRLHQNEQSFKGNIYTDQNKDHTAFKHS